MWTYNSLYHSGIKGMKWGIRKYQNEDGTLTAAGKARYLTKQGDIRGVGYYNRYQQNKTSEQLRKQAEESVRRTGEYTAEAKTLDEMADEVDNKSVGDMSNSELFKFRVSGKRIMAGSDIKNIGIKTLKGSGKVVGGMFALNALSRTLLIPKSLLLLGYGTTIRPIKKYVDKRKKQDKEQQTQYILDEHRYKSIV